LKRLVDACHAAGLAVILDVVYNHLGPEGNYFGEFGPYFTDRYKTPWGPAINYDGRDSDAVRHYFVSNALYWVTEYHIDALRLDAIHGIYDFSAVHILKELSLAIHAQAAHLNREILVIAESDLNDTRVIDPPARGGYGLDGQWNDDFHHALHVMLTGEEQGYYRDFDGLKDLAAAVREGFVYRGQYSGYRRRRHGSPSHHCQPSQLVVFAQNHDQVGNRAAGDRLSTRLSIDPLKVSQALVLLSPNVPLLFMGEEYGETAPFQYFIEHGDSALIEAVRQGRCREFSRFDWNPNEIPDPQERSTFERCRLNRERLESWQLGLLRWTSALIRLRTTTPSLGTGDGKRLRHSVRTLEREQVLILHRWTAQGDMSLLLLGFNQAPITPTLSEPVGRWHLRLDSRRAEFGGSGKDVMSQELLIRSEGAQLRIMPYTAAVFVCSRPENRL
jgi:maltooligosyltrehalose trehalohydrolase